MNIKTIRRGLAMVAILVVTAGILAATAGTGLAVASAQTPASASSHRLLRLPWDGMAPLGSVCHRVHKLKGEAIIWSNKVYPGKIQLWYSPLCDTTWARVETTKGAARVGVLRAKDLKVFFCGGKVKTIGLKACNTRMVNHSVSTSSAAGQVYYKGKWHTARTNPF